MVKERYGEQLGLSPLLNGNDVERRMQWYKRQVARDFEQAIRDRISAHSIISPIEQIFLLEWTYANVERRLKVAITPQAKVQANNLTYVVDFLITKVGHSAKIAVKLDGHNFHEKTRDQVAKDKSRERAIVG